MDKARILCIGTTPAAQRVMLFRKLTVDAVNRAAETLDGMAGKSVNVAKVLKALGEEPVTTGFAGGDRGDQLLAALSKRGIDQHFIPVAAPTRLCITVIDETAGTHTELVEESQPVSSTDYDRLIEIVREQAGRCRAVVMSGSIPPGGPEDLYAQCIRETRAAGVLTIVDAQAKPLAAALRERPGLVKPNRTELAATLGRPLSTGEDVLQGMRELHAQGAERVVVTAGPAPALAFDGRQFWRISPPSIAARNPIGSGDAFTAGLVWRLLRGDSLGEAARWATAAGSANALTWMPGELERADVERLASQVTVQTL
jgi:tagatose 6-phosphate kinase